MPEFDDVDADRTTVREVLEDAGVDPDGLDSVEELQAHVDVEFRSEGEPIDTADVPLEDVLDASVDIAAPEDSATDVIRQSTTDYPSDWDRRRRRVYERDDHQCQNCRRRGGPYGDVELHAHHIVPKSRGGVHRLENLVTLCEACHDAVHSRAARAPTALSEGEAQPSALQRLLAGAAGARSTYRQWRRLYRKISRFGP